MKTRIIEHNLIEIETLLGIPRYLGIELVEKIDASNEIIVEFGFSAHLKCKLNLDLEMQSFMKLFLDPMTPKAVASILNISPEVVLKNCRILAGVGIIQEVLTTKNDRYDRHSLFYSLVHSDPVHVQKTISSSTIAFIGMGGIGNWVTSALIGSGFSKFILLDFDIIELSNLTRQILFTEKDIGANKVDKAAERLRAMNSETEIVAKSFRAESAEHIEAQLQHVDFVVLSADSPSSIHDWIDIACLKLKIPYLNIGYRDGIGVVGPLTIPGKTSCYQCFKKHPEKYVMQSDFIDFQTIVNSRYQAPSFGPLNALVSAFAANEILKFLGGFGMVQTEGYEFNINPITFEQTFNEFKKDPECWHCSNIEIKNV